MTSQVNSYEECTTGIPTTPLQTPPYSPKQSLQHHNHHLQHSQNYHHLLRQQQQQEQPPGSEMSSWASGSSRNTASSASDPSPCFIETTGVSPTDVYAYNQTGRETPLFYIQFLKTSLINFKVMLQKQFWTFFCICTIFDLCSTCLTYRVPCPKA